MKTEDRTGKMKAILWNHLRIYSHCLLPIKGGTGIRDKPSTDAIGLCCIHHEGLQRLVAAKQDRDVVV